MTTEKVRDMLEKLNFSRRYISELQKHLVIVEVVTSSGIVNTMRLDQLNKFTKGPRNVGYAISYITAFLSRAIFRRFIEEIAWGSSVWIENEPNNIVHFEKIGKGVKKERSRILS